MSDNSKSRGVGYWIVTGLLAVMLIAAGVLDLIGAPEVTEVMDRLGYPSYLAPLLGFAKLLAMVVILAPGFPRLKEWAYAGVVIDLGGATYSHIRAGEPEQVIAPVLLLALALASWYLRPPARKLPEPMSR